MNLSGLEIKEQVIYQPVVAQPSSGFFQKYFRWIFPLTLLILALLAWYHRWMADDAFISFRYAENFVRGFGLVWNHGEHVEGYTNFLWTIMISGVIALGGNPAVYSQFIGVGFFILSLFLTYRISVGIFHSASIAFTIMVLLGFNYSFNAFATGGLESSMQTALFLLITYICVQVFLISDWSFKTTLWLSLSVTIAMLTRLDSAVVCIGIIVPAVFFAIKKDVLKKNFITHLILFSIPLILILGTWFLWKLSYYGDVLPNTFYTKVATPTSAEHGMYYLYFFFIEYFLIIFPIWWIFRIKTFFNSVNSNLVIVGIAMAAWLAYIIYIGGDHIEFRFLVPIIPFLFIVIGWLIFTTTSMNIVRVFFILIILAGTIRHELTYKDSADPASGIAPLRQFDEEFTKEFGEWSRAGRMLKEAFNGNKNVWIATSGAGAIPFYSELPTIDMLGLNDRWIAHHGITLGTVPGHQRISPMSYLVNRNVNILLGHPTIIKTGASLTQIPLAPMDSTFTLIYATLILAPISPAEQLVMVYLQQNSIVDEVIRRNNWGVINVKVNQLQSF